MRLSACEGAKLKGTTNIYCIYSRLKSTITQTGREIISIPDGNCNLCKEDTYNIIPDGEIIDGELRWRETADRDTGSLDPIGDSMYLWETPTQNITSGQVVNSTVKGRVAKFANNRYDYDPPNFHMSYCMEPINTTGILHEDEQCDLINGDHLQGRGWVEDVHGRPYKVIGRPNVDRCTDALYGALDRSTGKVVHKSQKTGYTFHFRDFTDYINPENNLRKRKLNIFEDSMDDISLFLYELDLEEYQILRLIDTYTFILQGEYISPSTILSNNGVNSKTINIINRNISTRNIKQLYENVNPKAMLKLYNYIIKGEVEGNLINMVNFILNDVYMKKGNIFEKKYVFEDITVTKKVKPRYQFYFYKQIIEDIILNKRIKINGNFFGENNIPEWFLLKWHDYNNYCKEMYNNMNPNDDEKSVPVLTLNQLFGNPNQQILNKFKQVIKVVERITPKLLKIIWEKFQDCHDDIDLFYKWVDDVYMNNQDYSFCTYSIKENNQNVFWQISKNQHELITSIYGNDYVSD